MQRSCQETSSGDLVQRSCQEVSYRDLANRALVEILNRDLGRRPVLEILYRDLAKRAEVLLRDPVMEILHCQSPLKNAEMRPTGIILQIVLSWKGFGIFSKRHLCNDSSRESSMLVEWHYVGLLLLLFASGREAHLNSVPAETVTVLASTT